MWYHAAEGPVVLMRWKQSREFPDRFLHWEEVYINDENNSENPSFGGGHSEDSSLHVFLACLLNFSLEFSQMLLAWSILVCNSIFHCNAVFQVWVSRVIAFELSGQSNRSTEEKALSFPDQLRLHAGRWECLLLPPHATNKKDSR